MLAPRHVRSLSVEPCDHPRGQRHLSAASGLVQVGHHLYIAVDDEHHLARLDAEDARSSTIELIRFMPGGLPHESGERKKMKPDVEVLMHVPARLTGGRELLLLLGSGSRAQRERAFVIELLPDGDVAAPALEVNAAMLYAPLAHHFDEVNIEGGYVDEGRMHLFQRANRGQSLNARISYDAAAFCEWLRDSAQAPPPLAVQRFALGFERGVPFGITDAAGRRDGGCLFTAVAENTSDAYSDGPCVASLLGRMDSNGVVRALEQLAGAPKVEGVAAAGDGRVWLVTDTDDPNRTSELLDLDRPF